MGRSRKGRFFVCEDESVKWVQRDEEVEKWEVARVSSSHVTSMKSIPPNIMSLPDSLTFLKLSKQLV